MRGRGGEGRGQGKKGIKEGVRGEGGRKEWRGRRGTRGEGEGRLCDPVSQSAELPQ